MGHKKPVKIVFYADHSFVRALDLLVKYTRLKRGEIITALVGRATPLQVLDCFVLGAREGPPLGGKGGDRDTGSLIIPPANLGDEDEEYLGKENN
jgi:hypothetical protein